MAQSPVELNQNSVVAGMLREYGELLRQQGAETFRAASYQHAADVVERLDRPLGQVFTAGGRESLMALPAVGRSIGAALAEMLTTGRWAQLERFRGTLEPEERFRTIAGVGPTLAKRIAEELHVDTLESLEVAAHDGRLAAIEGIGLRRAEMIRSALGERLGRPRLRRLRQSRERPSVDLLFDVDAEYRRRASAGELRTIAPKRFNPSGEAWLPIVARRLAVHRPLLEHGPRPRAGAGEGLGRGLLRDGRAARRAVHDCHGNARPHCEPARRSGTRAGMLELLGQR